MSKRGGRGKGGDAPTIVIRREEEGGHGHHGGAWKVAYADFVTAMMAFFLLMWLLNATTEEQRRGLADYFSPTNIFGRSMSGSGAPFGGLTPNVEGDMVSVQGAVQVETGPKPVVLDIEEDEHDTPIDRSPLRERPEGSAGQHAQGGRHAQPHSEGGEFPNPHAAGRMDVRTGSPGEGGSEPRQGPATSEAVRGGSAEGQERSELARAERQALEGAAEQIRQAIAADPALADLARQLLVEQTPEGLRIQLLDSERQPMFALGAAAPNPQARGLIQRVAQAAARLSNPIIISGHTDATPFRGSDRSNWELSSDRAHATRRLLTEAGVPEVRIRQVVGQADRDLLIPDQPNSPANRRVSILLLRQTAEARPQNAADIAGVSAR